MTAAGRGLLLSCVSQAARRGLWVLETPDHPHYAPPHPHSHVVGGPGVVHWRAPPTPRAPGLLEDPLENVLVLVAECQPYETALAIVDSALNQSLTSIQALETLPSPRLHDLVRHATPFSDSGIETIFRSRLGWLRLPIRVQTHLSGHRVDVLIGERLIVQVDGKQHSGPQRDADILHDAELRREGYEIIRVTYSLIIHRWEQVQEAVLSAIARGKHLRQAG
ncbi:endonuclease domain-containing protein [Leucobacter tenebrionis]|nr:endonuclease domain-containing protein [Leucobacter tenebrionis]